LREHDKILPAIMELHKKTGPLYGLFHSAGAVQTRPLHANTAAVTQFHVDLHVVAGLELARAVCRRDVMEPEGGSLLFVSSIYGRVGMPGQTSYCASKGAIAAAVRALAIELSRRNIRVNTLSPGLVMTEMAKEALSVLTESHVQQLHDAHPLGVGEPEDVARAAAFLLAPESRWITGTDLVVDGGFSAR
jgi:NAD(P)-dependent dehydrogenase (short-subunit alcohol dehydrogenase family)